MMAYKFSGPSVERASAFLVLVEHAYQGDAQFCVAS